MAEAVGNPELYGGGLSGYSEVIEMQVGVSQISLAVSIVVLIFSIIWNSRGDKRAVTKDLEDRIRTNTEISVKLSDIATTTREIKADVSDLRNDIQSHNDRLIKVEESCKQAHRRLDTLEQRVNQES